MPDYRIAILYLTLLLGVFWCLSVDSGHTEVAPQTAAYSALGPARFEIALRQKTLHLDGHTVSNRHEKLLLQASERSFSGLTTSTRFMPLGTLPEQWADMTLSLVEALSATQSSRASLTLAVLRIRGVAADDWNERLRDLRAALRGSVTLDVDVLVPDTDIDVAQLCARASAAQETGPINFEESGTNFRSSAYAQLDRIISLADACRQSSISITGHTDSSGDEASNRHLSLARANAVANYLASRGVARERLLTLGAGSSVPVADNATRYGRSLNRRIEVFLAPP
ncbi:MAG: OmpA family protein [Gammaproteobacteria bacterium]|nr:OmpA family protein [Gammaproteobacteria bacterium]